MVKVINVTLSRPKQKSSRPTRARDVSANTLNRTTVNDGQLVRLSIVGLSKNSITRILALRTQDV